MDSRDVLLHIVLSRMRQPESVFIIMAITFTKKLYLAHGKSHRTSLLNFWNYRDISYHFYGGWQSIYKCQASGINKLRRINGINSKNYHFMKIRFRGKS